MQGGSVPPRVYWRRQYAAPPSAGAQTPRPQRPGSNRATPAIGGHRNAPSTAQSQGRSNAAPATPRARIAQRPRSVGKKNPPLRRGARDWGEMRKSQLRIAIPATDAREARVSDSAVIAAIARNFARPTDAYHATGAVCSFIARITAIEAGALREAV